MMKQFILVILVVLVMSALFPHNLRISPGHHIDDFVAIEAKTETDSNDLETIAIIYKTKTIDVNDTCGCERFVALVEGTMSSSIDDKSQYATNRQYDVILLHEPEEDINPALVEWVEQSRHRERVKIVNAPLAADYFNETTNGFRQYKTEKANVVLWIHELHARNESYSHYWLVEDDIFWTGTWRDFFETNDRITGDADFVAIEFAVNADTWSPAWMAQTCEVNGEVCYNTRTRMIRRTFNNLFRISDRFMRHLLEMLFRDALQGHDEVNFIAALNQANSVEPRSEAPFVHVQLFDEITKSMHGLDTMGGWSSWSWDTSKPIYSLRGLAEVARKLKYRRAWVKKDAMWLPWRWYDEKRLDKQAWDGVARVYKSNLDVPRNKIFHPIKCAADYDIGPAALAFAVRENSLVGPRVESLRSVCYPN